MSGKSGLAAFLKDELAKPVAAEPKVETPSPASNATNTVQTTSLETQRGAKDDKNTEPVTPKTTKPVSNRVTKSVSNRVTESSGAYYLTLTRKEVRLRDDQYDELTHLARQLNRQRTGTSERITENTLIRVAIDHLLKNKKLLGGSTESEFLTELDGA